jgi:hypothetical protein
MLETWNAGKVGLKSESIFLIKNNSCSNFDQPNYPLFHHSIIPGVDLLSLEH